MRPSDAELSFNPSWMFLQFKVYEMSFDTMRMIISDLQNGNHSGQIPFINIEDHHCYFKVNRHSNRVNGCVLLQIEITKAQYNELKQVCPENEDKS